ncbi:Gar1/Naf1 RNA binding region-domain-containing protein [Pholiota molesta]|nr:Gar1/Naf1 RNA binding region-domain-containing protein [Pholiota molesta]
MNIVDRLAIVRGLPAGSPPGYPARGSDRALDSDTLLVFDDRKVMGYIYETFGPTIQPFYQVKFNAAFPLDPERVRVGREVFHVPTRSRFVFVNQIKAFKGSDASNVHDEEPADDELEFSDDEAEAAYKSRLKRKRGESRSRSVVSSRQSTPNPTQMRDQELADEAILSRNAYDEHGPYDIDYAAPGPSSRPAPIPYDDPYGDDYTAPDVADREAAAVPTTPRTAWNASGSGRGGRRGDERGPERRDGPVRERERERGRTGGRGRERGGRGRGRGGGEGGGRGSHQQRHSISYDTQETYDARPLSPTSLAIARATGQPSTYTPPQQPYQQHSYGQQNAYPSSPVYPQDPSSPWGYPQMASQYLPQQMHQYGGAYGGYQQNQVYQNQQRFDFGGMAGAHGAPFVQPHINPRFASAFGLGGLPQMPQGYGPSAGGISGVSSNDASPSVPTRTLGSSVASVAPSMGWAATTDEWAVSMQHGITPGSTRPGSAASGADMDVQK